MQLVHGEIYSILYKLISKPEWYIAKANKCGFFCCPSKNRCGNMLEISASSSRGYEFTHTVCPEHTEDIRKATDKEKSEFILKQLIGG